MVQTTQHADLVSAVSARIGRTIDSTWVDTALAEAMAYVRLLAPCKKATWLSWGDLPLDVQAVVAAAIARFAENPRGYRQETIGEYSYTVGSGSVGTNGPFTAAEARIIASESGCGGSFKTVHMTSPAPLSLEVPEQRLLDSDGDEYKPSGVYWDAPSHANGWQGGWKA